MVAKFKIGRKVVSHVFEKDDKYYWNTGAPSKNKSKAGYSYKFKNSAFNAGLIYAKNLAKHLGRHLVIVEYPDKKKDIYKI